jgi:hypothetical protein
MPQSELKSKYNLFLNPSHTIIGVAKKINMDIILQLEELPKKARAKTLAKGSKIPSANSFIHSDSDEELLQSLENPRKLTP